MIKLLFLMTGGALGTLARYAASGLAHRWTDSLFPIGTLVVNSIGSLLIGIVWAFWEDSLIPGYIRTFLLIGFFGGFTTFSSFSLETLNLIRDNEVKLAVLNIFANNIIGILFVFGGFFTTRLLIGLMK
ncbi:fluoride efflux transporter CrcB [Bacteroidota bacterium]